MKHRRARERVFSDLVGFGLRVKKFHLTVVAITTAVCSMIGVDAFNEASRHARIRVLLVAGRR
jgi:hypothetical protein